MAIAAGHWSADLVREKHAASLHSQTRMQGLKDGSARILEITTIRWLLSGLPRPC
jgi:hypothetical protein